MAGGNNYRNLPVVIGTSTGTPGGSINDVQVNDGAGGFYGNSKFQFDGNQVNAGCWLNIVDDKKGLTIKGGSPNSFIGNVRLVAGSATVLTPNCGTGYGIYLGGVTPLGTPGALYIKSVDPGVKFIINSTSGSDVSIVQYLIIVER